MDGDDHGNDGAPQGDTRILPVGETTPEPLPKVAVNPPAPPPVEQNISTDLQNESGTEEMEDEREPFSIRIIKDDELSTFERQTVRLGFWGVMASFLSLGAASVAAYVVFQQFKEMSAQTELLNRGARQARIDSANSAASTANQLRVLQDQLAQQQNAMILDQRAWLGIRDISLSHPLVAGHAVDFVINAFNSGRTPALHVVLEKLSVGTDETHPDVVTTRVDQSVVAPNGSILINGTVGSQADAQLIDALISGDAKIYVRGRIVYQDIFKKPHKILFCAYWLARGKSLTFYNCKSGNFMD
jgi:hypothetical protein